MISAKPEYHVSELSLQSAEDVGIEFEQIALQKLTDTYKLLLVSAQYPNDTTEQQIDIVSAYNRIPLSIKDIYLEEETLQHAERMVRAARKDGIRPVITSGYRSPEEQAKLYHNAPNENYVAKPGESEHELGLAIDIRAMEERSNPTLYNWLAEHAHQYGFILRYPESKAEITGIAYEPWHYRYVGIPHSHYINKQALSLEEYIDAFIPDNFYTLTVDKSSYIIYKTNPVLGEIRVPSGKKYAISGDGTGSYIITVNLRN